MNALRVLSDERAVLIQAGFFCCLVFLAAYTRWHRWWETVFGTVLFLIFLGLAVMQLPLVLSYWHAADGPLPPMLPDAWSWVAVTARVIVPASALMLAWLTWRTRLRRQVGRRVTVTQQHLSSR